MVTYYISDMTVSVFSGSASSFSEANYKPSFLPNEELKHLVLKVPVIMEAENYDLILK